MAEVIRMPRMSDTMTEGTFVQWFKNVGDKVKSGDILAEVETDKAAMELESYWNGTLLYIGVEKGQAAQVDQVIAIIGKEGEDYKPLLQNENGAQPKTENKEAPKEDVKPDIIKKPEPGHEEQNKNVNDQDKKPESDETGLNKEETDVNKLKETKHDSSGKKNEPPSTETPTDDRIKASPLAKKLAAEKGIDISAIKGTGDNGRITKHDVESYSPPQQEKTQVKEETKKEQPKIPLTISQFVGEESFEEMPVSQMRKTIAARLSQSKFTSPHFYLTVSIDMDQAIEARKSINEAAPVKISFNDIIVKACALALRQHPQVNSSWLGEKISISKHIHIGIAVAVNEGLLVPVIRFADNKSLTQIAMETNNLAERARNRKLQPQDWEGNTFTISNLGMMGIEEFTAIINPPDACILAVGAINQIPVVRNNEIKIGNVMKLTMSCDHRIVDGAVGARFLQTLKLYLENPVRMLI